MMLDRLMVCGLLTTLLMTPAFSAEPNTTDYQFMPLDEVITKPWHRTYIDPTPTPQGQPNAGADYLNNFLAASLADRLEKTLVRSPWREYGKFLNWAVWGYLSPDSQYRGDERLPPMMRAWIADLLTKLATRPEDPQKAEKWTANRIGDSWSFADYTIPMLALDQTPELVDAIGRELVQRYRGIVVASIEDKTRPEQFNALIAKADHYVNMATHPMAVYVHGWLLTGEDKYLKMAQSIVAILQRDQMPNGMFPYRIRLQGDRHLEFETMYYRAIDIRALFLYWWVTGSKVAEQCLQRSVPWYPLNLEPPYHFNDGPDIWWKDQWRTFWSMHVAMVAAAAKDGENATIARRMAADKISVDRFDLVLGALAYRLMAEVESRPVRDQYVVEDPDIRGLRLRQAPFSCTFTAGSFTYTRASAMLVRPNGKAFDALHMARPCIRVTPLERASKTDRDYTMLGPNGADHSADIAGSVAAVGTVYAPALTAATWHDDVPTAPWRVAELWFMTPHALVGLIDSTAQEDTEAFEFNHQYRFIVADNAFEPAAQSNLWNAGGLRFQIWDTDFPHRVLERVRRFALNPDDRRDIQLSLKDLPRQPEQEAQQPGQKDDDAPPPLSKTTIPAGYHRYSLVSISPAQGPAVTDARLLSASGAIGFSCTVDGRRYKVVMNPAEQSKAQLGPRQVQIVLDNKP